jgi:hypothetical protein
VYIRYCVSEKNEKVLAVSAKKYSYAEALAAYDNALAPDSSSTVTWMRKVDTIWMLEQRGCLLSPKSSVL